MQNVVDMEEDNNCICVEDGEGNKVCSPKGCGENIMHCRVHYNGVGCEVHVYN